MLDLPGNNALQYFSLAHRVRNNHADTGVKLGKISDFLEDLLDADLFLPFAIGKVL
jgi:hypothetical protein